MTKEEFAAQLRHRLEHMPEAETDKWVEFYLELIDDRIEEGADEAEAVGALGSLDEITENIVAELPLAAAVRERARERGESVSKPWIVLAVLGAPVSAPLLLAAVAVAAAGLVSIVAVVVAAAGAWFTLFICGAAAAVYAFLHFAALGTAGAMFMAGLCLACFGAGLALVWPLWELIKLLARLLRRLGRWLKSKFIGKGGEGT
ncbi:MAG: DUF1700 domain-containing protein [Oscillospiraceae bacterium]|nr:DUF1700 domain-containing protein [Oscillospiraceae bacterium]